LITGGVDQRSLKGSNKVTTALVFSEKWQARGGEDREVFLVWWASGLGGAGEVWKVERQCFVLSKRIEGRGHRINGRIIETWKKERQRDHKAGRRMKETTTGRGRDENQMENENRFQERKKNVPCL